jgi:phage recombination protein Bet
MGKEITANEVTVTKKNEVIQQVDMQTIVEYLDSTGLTKKLMPNEKTMFINIAQLYGLNPFKREIYCNVYGEGQYRQCSIITGYEVYLKRADRLGKLDGWDASLDGKVSDGTLSATITIYRKDWSHPFKHTVYYREVVQTKKDGTPNRFWQTQPTFMTRKVAVAQAFRLCFPDEFGGMPYTNDELGVEQPAPIVERNVTPEVVEGKIIDESKNFQNDDKQALKTILEKYESALEGVPYNLSCEAIAENDPAKISEMLGRCKVYLGKKGIKVA